jgi:hypothetical protein
VKSASLIATLTFCLFGLSATTRVHASSRAEKKACVAASTEGQTARDEGRLLEARKFLLECARDSCPRVVRKSCGAWLGEIDRRTPSVLIRVTDAWEDDVTDARASIDGAPVVLDGRPIPLDPGQHVVAVTAPGGAAAGRKFLLAENEKSRVVSVRLRSPSESTVTEAAAAASPTPVAARDIVPAPRRRYMPPRGAFILGAVGAVALTTATGFGISALRKRRDLARTCAPEAGGAGCSDHEVKPAKRSARIADVTLGIGVASILGAAAWTVYAWSRGAEPGATPAVSLMPQRDGAVAAYSRAF